MSTTAKTEKPSRLNSPLLLLILLLVTGGLITYGILSVNGVFEDRGPSSGTVITKTYAPSYVEEHRRCAAFVRAMCMRYETYEETVPAVWEVVYQDENGDIGYDEVSPTEYADIEVGDYYERD